MTGPSPPRPGRRGSGRGCRSRLRRRGWRRRIAPPPPGSRCRTRDRAGRSSAPRSRSSRPQRPLGRHRRWCRRRAGPRRAARDLHGVPRLSLQQDGPGCAGRQSGFGGRGSPSEPGVRRRAKPPEKRVWLAFAPPPTAWTSCFGIPWLRSRAHRRERELPERDQPVLGERDAALLVDDHHTRVSADRRTAHGPRPPRGPLGTNAQPSTDQPSPSPMTTPAMFLSALVLRPPATVGREDPREPDRRLLDLLERPFMSPSKPPSSSPGISLRATLVSRNTSTQRLPAQLALLSSPTWNSGATGPGAGSRRAQQRCDLGDLASGPRRQRGETRPRPGGRGSMKPEVALGQQNASVKLPPEVDVDRQLQLLAHRADEVALDLAAA